MKKGFTLVEIMVVIVILGVLAAVGVPKLFGSIAKAKASEVPIAAETYVKLQDAFLAEKSSLGNWKSIGYIAENSTNFCYSQGSLTESTTSIDDISSGIIGWGAKSLVSLNDCGAGSWWSLVMTSSGSNSINYAHNISYEPCIALTSNWSEGQTLVGDCKSATTIPNKNNSDKSDKNDNPVGSSTSKDTQPTQSTANENQVQEPETDQQQESYQQCYDRCYEESRHGNNVNGAARKCQNQCSK